MLPLFPLGRIDEFREVDPRFRPPHHRARLPSHNPQHLRPLRLVGRGIVPPAQGNHPRQPVCQQHRRIFVPDPKPPYPGCGRDVEPAIPTPHIDVGHDRFAHIPPVRSGHHRHRSGLLFQFEREFVLRGIRPHRKPKHRSPVRNAPHRVHPHAEAIEIRPLGIGDRPHVDLSPIRLLAVDRPENQDEPPPFRLVDPPLLSGIHLGLRKGQGIAPRIFPRGLNRQAILGEIVPNGLLELFDFDLDVDQLTSHQHRRIPPRHDRHRLPSAIARPAEPLSAPVLAVVRRVNRVNPLCQPNRRYGAVVVIMRHRIPRFVHDIEGIARIGRRRAHSPFHGEFFVPLERQRKRSLARPQRTAVAPREAAASEQEKQPASKEPVRYMSDLRSHTPKLFR